MQDYPVDFWDPIAVVWLQILLAKQYTSNRQSS
jgi:hypothetical protein